MAKSHKASKDTATSTLRIIGGAHRGRKLPIPSLDGLRPTSDRIRETAFNWIQFELPGMAVLDLFSGTGALGLEALSRGAKEAVFIEPQVIAAQSIRASLATLGMDNGAVNTQLAEQYLKGSVQSFDLVFIDPPFSLDLWDETLATLVAQNWLSSGAFIYLECPKHMTVNIPSELTTIKDKTGGQVRFRLLQKRN